MADTRERVFQNDIIAALESQGWLIGKASEYDKVNAVYPEDLIGYSQAAYSDRWEKFCKNKPQNPEKVLIKAATRELDKHGTLEQFEKEMMVSRLREAQDKINAGISRGTSDQ